MSLAKTQTSKDLNLDLILNFFLILISPLFLLVNIDVQRATSLSHVSGRTSSPLSITVWPPSWAQSSTSRRPPRSNSTARKVPTINSKSKTSTRSQCQFNLEPQSLVESKQNAMLSNLIPDRILTVSGPSLLIRILGSRWYHFDESKVTTLFKAEGGDWI